VCVVGSGAGGLAIVIRGSAQFVVGVTSGRCDWPFSSWQLRSGHQRLLVG
jgi:hypothetical protein